MKSILKTVALVLVVAAGTVALPLTASAQAAKNATVSQPDPAVIDAYLKSTFGKAPPEWQARIEPDETLKTCNQYRNDVPSAEADKIVTRELAKVTANMVDATLSGKQPEINDTKTYNNGVKVVPSYLLKPVPVDASNWKKVLVDSGYYKESQVK